MPRRRVPSVRKIQPAKGVRGTILPFFRGRKVHPVFRVYATSGAYRRKQMRLQQAGKPYDRNAWKFKDYEITHYDFDVVINEDFAVLCEFHNGRRILDYPIYKTSKRTAKASSKNRP